MGSDTEPYCSLSLCLLMTIVIHIYSFHIIWASWFIKLKHVIDFYNIFILFEKLVQLNIFHYIMFLMFSCVAITYLSIFFSIMRHSVTFQSPFSRLIGRYISVTIQCHSVTIPSSFSNIHFSFLPYITDLTCIISSYI